MSFPIICPNCGAPSSPSVGVCPFCKSVLTNRKGEKVSPTILAIQERYNTGQIDRALQMAQMAEKNKPQLRTSPRFLLLYVKILLETDGPSSLIRSLIGRGLIEHPQNPDLLEYLEVVEAKSLLNNEADDLGEVELETLIRRSPKNVHALFLLGSHLFWVEKETQRSLVYLQQCYRLRPEFLRATACLGALMKNLGLEAQASRLFRQCAQLETNQDMKKYFQQLAQ